MENNLHIGMPAPNFEADTTFGKLCLNDYKTHWLVFFSHPGDFTPVCTTEFLAFASCYQKFKEINTELLGLSIDSNMSHLAWVDNIYKNSNVMIPFPVVADTCGEISTLYNMRPKDSKSTVRTVYIIDPTGTIRTILTYPKEVGRNIEEILRIVKALQFSDEQNVVMPANWMPNTPVALKAPNTYEDLNERILNKKDFAYFDWYLCFKKNNSNLLGGEVCE